MDLLIRVRDEYSATEDVLTVETPEDIGQIIAMFRVIRDKPIQEVDDIGKHLNMRSDEIERQYRRISMYLDDMERKFDELKTEI